VTTYAKDQGRDFGLWPDPTSRLLYHDAMPVLLNGVELPPPILDLGGANGLLRDFVDGPVTTLDIDLTKQPDIVGDARTWSPPERFSFGSIVVRYLLHYLDDDDVWGLFHLVHGYHRGPLLVIQFTNEPADMPAKVASSRNETAFFRTPTEVEGLFGPWKVRDRKRIDYRVCKEFYVNRLGNPDGVEHGESVCGWVLEP
jgi:hypothetical protein